MHKRLKMKQFYLISFLLSFFLLCAAPTNAQIQEETVPTEEQEMSIEGLSIYPNPALGSKIYIRTKKNEVKHVEVYNILGKAILSARLTGPEFNISSLEKGIYFLKIQEGDKTSTRKLVVR